MDIIKKYGLYFLYGAIAVLLLINFIIFNQSLDTHASSIDEVKRSQSSQKDEIRKLKELEQEIIVEKERTEELMSNFEDATVSAEERKEKEAKLAEEITSLMAEIETIQMDRALEYQEFKQKDIDEDIIIKAVSIAKDKKMKIDDYSYKFDTSDYTLGSLYKKGEYYLVYTFEQFATVFSFTKQREIEHIYMVDLKREELISDKSYDKLYLE